MALEPAITDLEQLKDRAELARLLAWKADAVEGAKFDRNELSMDELPQLLEAPQMAKKLESARQLAKDMTMVRKLAEASALPTPMLNQALQQ